MEVGRVLHMNGGVGEASYANNSLVQGKVISMTKPIIDAAITELIMCSSSSMARAAKSLCMAELGCSSGPNTLIVATEFVKLVSQLCRKHGHDQLPEFQIQLNDLPETISTPFFQVLCPQLFAAKSLHFVHSSYSLMWLSKFQRDFSTFLRCRSEEVIGGGKMVLTLLGRRSESASSKECCYIWELLALSLKEMVSQGLIEEEKLGSFNIPQYTPSLSEVKTEVKKEGSFTINRLQVSEIAWAACGDGGFCSLEYSKNGVDNGYNVAKCMRSVVEPLLVEHFGELVIDQLFENYRNILSDRMSKEDTKFINVTVSMTRKD
ncbi:UNVERIFIED_CONTAM: Salicylate carboxymethyltransferase [Sesamum latifolium]|uniref:Salicylate carboxymethyltransferase n=1 Tax=Sesamum latifolium TaxID=2727402 RepID=A0AAW2VXN3_9LAMI